MHNFKKIKQGRYPSLLTLKGIDQMKSIAHRMADICSNFDNYKIITSPMIRTRHSAQILSEMLNITENLVIEEENINEIDCGDLSNTKKEIILQKYPNLDEDKKKDLLNFRYPNGESYNDVYSRIERFCNGYKNEKNLIILTHGIGVQFIKAILEGKSKDSFLRTNTDQNYCFYWNGKDVIRI